jgi:hypothetical protein
MSKFCYLFITFYTGSIRIILLMFLRPFIHDNKFSKNILIYNINANSVRYGVEFYFPQFRTYTSEYLHFDSCRNAHSEELRLRYVAGPIFEIILYLVPTCVRIGPCNLELNYFYYYYCLGNR